MKIRFWVDSGANIKSKRTSKWFDIEEVYGLSDEEWNDMEDGDKYDLVEQWVNEQISYGWEEQK